MDRGIYEEHSTNVERGEETLLLPGLLTPVPSHGLRLRHATALI